jgi:hypothetical protein
VSAELHIFAGVGHGFGLPDTTRGPVAGWMDLFYGWLGKQGLLQQKITVTDTLRLPIRRTF